ncbi:hypothetical protein Hanom_Chr06g00501951 [Helianthus anomalus]
MGLDHTTRCLCLCLVPSSRIGCGGETITSYPVANDYMSWFMRHTILYLTNPRSSAVPMCGFQDDGARAQMLTDAMGVIQRSDDLELAQATAYQATEMPRQEGYSQYPSHLTTDPIDLTPIPRPQRLRRR